MPAQRILFVVRGKLGDSLIPYATVKNYIDAHPDHEVWLLTRKPYARPLRDEAGLHLVPFNSRIEMMAKLIWMRWTQPAFDVLAVLWGFGNPILRVSQLVRTKRRIYLDGSFPEAYPEWPQPYVYANHSDRAWRVTQVFDPAIAKPSRLTIASLKARREARARRGAVVVIPAADEDRRTLDVPTLCNLLAGVAERHPGHPLWLVVNPRDRRVREFVTATLPKGVEVKRFSSVSGLIELLMDCDYYYGMDTGVYHLAVAMGIEATVFFGGTQPLVAIMPEQGGVRSVRLTVLGNEHCDVTTCACPLCLYQAADSFFGKRSATPLADTPAACPLRAFPGSELAAIAVRAHPPD
jgi:ADP-heptose:LPS heptosyltransferase